MLPAIVFTKVGTKPDLLRLEVGAGDLDRKLINDGRPYPIIRFDVLHFPNIPSPIIFAAAMEPGGSDCSYVAAVVGEREGKITPLAPKLPLVNAEGGYGIESSKPDGLELLTWNFIWGAGESHVDPHDYWVQVYRFDAGRFVFSRRYIVKKNQPKISFPNLLRRLKDFGC